MLNSLLTAALCMNCTLHLEPFAVETEHLGQCLRVPVFGRYKRPVAQFCPSGIERNRYHAISSFTPATSNKSRIEGIMMIDVRATVWLPGAVAIVDCGQEVWICIRRRWPQPQRQPIVWLGLDQSTHRSNECQNLRTS